MADVQGAWIEIQTLNRAPCQMDFLTKIASTIEIDKRTRAKIIIIRKQQQQQTVTVTETETETEKCNNNKI